MAEEKMTAGEWAQAEVARRMEYTRGGVNGIVSGDQEPSAAAGTRPMRRSASSDSPERAMRSPVRRSE